MRAVVPRVSRRAEDDASGLPSQAMKADMNKRTLPFVDLVTKQARFAKRYHDDLERVLASGSFILGHEVESLESSVAKYTGAPHAVGVANCTDALVLGLKR